MFICEFCLIKKEEKKKEKKESKTLALLSKCFEGIKVYQINMIKIKLRFNLINIISPYRLANISKSKKYTFMSYEYLKKYQICKC